MTRLTEIIDTAPQGAEPPAGLTPPQQALWWLAHGGWQMGPAWQKAHQIAQTAEGDPSHDLVHALAHHIEGDRGNSDYWYRRAGDTRVHDDAQVEGMRIAGVLDA